jgi:protease II
MRVPISSSSSPSASTSEYSLEHWKDVTPYSDLRELSYLLAFKTGLIVFGRENGNQKIWSLLKESVAVPTAVSPAVDSSIASMDSSLIFVDSSSSTTSSVDLSPHPHWHEIPFPEVCYSIRSRNNRLYDTPLVRVEYSSFLTPKSTIDINFHTNEQIVLKRKEVPHYDPENYLVRRIFVNSNHTEGCQIPISLVFHRSLLPSLSETKKGKEEKEDESLPINHPMLLYGYGSYGACIDPSFDYTRLPLLDRGIIYGIAHIRGGGEMGRSQWYEQGGKYFNKMNTFYDFKDCALGLIDRKVTSSDRLAIVGRSAGGLLIGATINLYPDLFKAAVADVPFVDVVNTMSDPTIPLTVVRLLILFPVVQPLSLSLHISPTLSFYHARGSGKSGVTQTRRIISIT